MDASGIQIVISFTSVASFIGAVGAVIKAFRSQAVAKEARAETDVIQRERKTQAEFRDNQVQKLETELEVVKSQLASHNQMLDEYNAGPVAHDILYIKKGIVKFGDGFMKFSREEVDDILRGIWRCWGMSRFIAGCADKAIEVVAGGSNHWGNDSYHVKEFCDVKVEVLE